MGVEDRLEVSEEPGPAGSELDDVGLELSALLGGGHQDALGLEAGLADEDVGLALRGALHVV